MEGTIKMKKIKLKPLIKCILLMTIMLFGIISCNFLANKTIHVPNSIIQEKTSKKFPITKNFIVASVTLKNPKVDFKDEKMLIETDYSISLLDENSKGKMYLNSGIRYDEVKEELYLVDLSVDKIVNDKGQETANSRAENTLKTLITNYVEMTPVYKYGEEERKREEKGKKSKIKIKNMYIKKVVSMTMSKEVRKKKLHLF